ncbi:putative coil containing protein [Vibrio phage 249E41-1]|nr:putative coil containing protein [Vibrio phage 249E41-1]
MKTYKYEPQLGSDIKNVIEKCIELSQYRSMKGFGSVIEFEFNGIVMKVDHRVSIDTGYWVSVWETSTKERQKAYEQTPEYKEKQLKFEVKLKENQQRCDNLMTIFEHSTLEDGHALDAWMLEFIPVADRVGVDYDKNLIVTTLESLGYTANEFVGYQGEWDVTSKSRWVYGQILNGLKTQYGIHPIFVDKIKQLSE